MQDDIFRVLFQAILSFVVLFILSKLLGKKQVAQLEFIDYAVGISIGSIAAQMAIDPQIPYYHFIIAMVVYALLDLLLTIISRKSSLLKKIFKGKPLIIINQGQIDYKMLKKSKMDINELLSQIRVKGYFDLSQVHYCIFEPSGEFSVMPKNANQNVQNADLNINKPDKSLKFNFIVDGKINTENLKLANKDVDWLLKKANIKNKKDLTNILLLSYDQSSDQIFVHPK